jgi:peptidoglycan-associated lipoprotein
MRGRIFLFAAFFAAVAVTTGCHSMKRPSPGDTVFKPAKPSADWIDPTKIYGQGAAGLSMRDSNFMNADSKRIENLLQSVYFDTDKSSIAPSERTKVTEAAEYLKGNPKDKLLVEGYCDWRGTREYNLALGDRRASGVKQYLEDLGVDPERVQTISHGDLMAEENASPETMKQDRRAAQVVIR